MKKVDTFLFDLDGTLLDSNKLIIDAFKHVFKTKFPDLTLTEEEYMSFIGPTLWTSFSKYEPDLKRVDELVLLYREYSDLYYDDLKAFDGAKELLKTLKERGYKIGVVSSKMHPLVVRALKITNMIDYVDVVVGFEDVKNHKPHPEGLLLAEKLLKSKRSIYVGDHPSDVKAGKKAHMLTCGVSYSYHKDIIKEEPDFMIDNLLCLLEESLYV